MRKFDEPEILELAARWRARARIFRAEATDSASYTDKVRLAGMVSTLVWCALDLCANAGVDPNEIPLPPGPEVDRETKVADEKLGPPAPQEGSHDGGAS